LNSQPKLTLGNLVGLGP